VGSCAINKIRYLTGEKSRAVDKQTLALVKTLTGREWCIIRYLSEDVPIAEIAETEFVSIPTVNIYVYRIGEKLCVKGRGAVARFARCNKEALEDLWCKLYQNGKD